ncbi:MAG: STAS domain-containing protein [Vampirovibrio sp.]|nr:STAS domain-containing protein [Vampirovibrio sp.]
MDNETNIVVRESGDKCIVLLDTQNVDFRNCETIKSSVANLVNTGKTHLILGLEKVSFMDSSGLSVLLFCKRTCEEAQGSFTMFGLQSYVNNLVTLTNLNKSIEIFESESDALKV